MTIVLKCNCGGMRHTYIDESYRRVKGSENPGVYLLAAVSLDVTVEDSIRLELEQALPRKMSRFHWHSDDVSTRDASTAVLNAAGVTQFILLQSGVPPKRQERARQNGLWELVVQMRDRCCHNLCFESRERQQDERDRRTLKSIHKSPVGGPLFQYRFGRPLDEPLLWLPDTTLGVFGSNEVDARSRWWDSLSIKPEVVRVGFRA